MQLNFERVRLVLCEMGTCGKILAVSVAIFAVFAYVSVKSLFEIPELPELGEKWWKVEKPPKVDTSIKPFKIQISDQVLKDLKERLNKTLPFQAPLHDVKQNYGFNTNLLKTVIDYWKTKYDWRKREQFLNQYPQFTTNIQGLNIHFIHVKPAEIKGLKVLPILMLHGWPGSVREFYEIIPLLTKPIQGRDFVFELIIPSLPGYGFSEAAEVPGLSAIQMGVTMNNLMKRIGFERYYIQGGNWGGAIGPLMATVFPENVIGLHSNLCYTSDLASALKVVLGSFYPSLVVEEKYKHLIYPGIEKFFFLNLEAGYLHIQSSKPDTIGIGLRESPAGLAAYILEKFVTWTNKEWKDLEDGGLTKKFTLDQLLDNIMIYWVTRSITTSHRMYAETFNKAEYSALLKIESNPVVIPSGCSRFERDLLWYPESILRHRYKNLVHITSHDDGGDFAAFESPQVLAKDVVHFIGKVEELRKNIG